MSADSKPPARALCDAIAAAVVLADRRGDHLTGALLMQAYEAAGCSQDAEPNGTAHR